MKIAALIPARSGSKRLPGKNIKPLGGKPLLFWSIDAAIETDAFSRICVSSESDEIIQLVRKRYPASEVQILKRPPELASDTASLNEVCKHYLRNEPEIEFLSLMMPTYPFRRAQRIIEDILPPLYSGQVDRVVSVRSGNYSTSDYWIKKDQHYHRMYKNAPLWCGASNSAYTFQKREYFFLPHHKWPYHLGERTLRVQTDYLESIDIDTIDDFAAAEKRCDGDLPKLKKLYVYENDAIEFLAPEGADFTSFLDFIRNKGVKSDSPILILRHADPLFTFLRWYECNSSGDYFTESTKAIIANLPESGHSQDFPVHYVHSPCYRVLRKEQDKCGILEDSVPDTQIVFEDELKREWADYVDPIEWISQTHD